MNSKIIKNKPDKIIWFIFWYIQYVYLLDYYFNMSNTKDLRVTPLVIKAKDLISKSTMFNDWPIEDTGSRKFLNSLVPTLKYDQLLRLITSIDDFEMKKLSTTERSTEYVKSISNWNFISTMTKRFFGKNKIK